MYTAKEDSVLVMRANKKLSLISGISCEDTRDIHFSFDRHYSNFGTFVSET